MIIVADKKYVAAAVDNEEEIERVVLENAEYIFGANSIMLAPVVDKQCRRIWNYPRPQ